MGEETLYLKLNRKIKTQKEKICIKDIAKIYCSQKEIADKIQKMEVYRMQGEKEKRCVLGILRIISLIQGQYPRLNIQSIGETEVIVEYVQEKKGGAWFPVIKIILVSAVCFFGTVFTVMAYHNDINILQLFERVKTVMGEDPGEKITILEISYSLGLSLGIIIFYNHVGKRSLTTDPTPVAVEMRTYEDQINQSLVELAEREGKIIDLP